MAIVRELSGLVEQVSVDEAFIDVSDLSDDVETIARELQKRVFQQTALPCSIGAASCKLVAKSMWTIAMAWIRDRSTRWEMGRAI